MSSPPRKFCAHCGIEISLESNPLFCPYCGFRISDAPPPVSPQSTKEWNSTSFPPYTMGRTRQPFRFSRVEVRDILVGWIALSIAFTTATTGGLLDGFSSRLDMTVNGVTEYLSLEMTFILALMTIGIGFVLHELMHKFISERYGFRAEFRMWLQGLGLALFSALFLGIVFAAPGATYFMGSGVSKKENGIISIAGPLTNVAIALLFLPLLFVNTNNLIILEAGFLGSYFNFFLATFNMLPIYVLDGAKVWRWNKLYWAALFIPLAIVVVAFITGYFP